MLATPNQILSQAIEAQKEPLARAVIEIHWARNPQFEARYGESGRAKCQQDVTYNLAYLSQAIASNSPRLFVNYLEWIKTLFAGLNIARHELSDSLGITREVLLERFPGQTETIIQAFIDLGLQHLTSQTEDRPSHLAGDHPLTELARQYLANLQRGDRAAASRLILEAVAGGASVPDIYLRVFQPTQYELGRLWQMNQMSVAQEHYCTAVTQLIMSQLYANIFNTPKNGRRLVATCVGSELHEIGLRMVADFFELEGWDTYYLGSNTPASGVLQALTERKAEVLAVSATMTFHVRSVADLITSVRVADPRRRIKILAGGYPFNIEPNLWRQVGADGTASNAAEALQLAKTW